MAIAFIPLCVHSNTGFLAGAATALVGASPVEALLARAKELGYPAMGLTDTDGIYNVFPFMTRARALGVHPVVGAHVTLSDEDDAASLTALARTREGYSRLCRLVTARKLDGAFDPFEHLGSAGADLFLLADSTEVLERAISQVGRRVVFAALPLPADRERERRAQALADFARKNDLATAAAPRIYLAREEDRDLQRVLTAIKKIVSIEELDPRELAPANSHLMSPAEYAHCYRDFPEALANTVRIARACRVEKGDSHLFSSNPIFPTTDLPEGETPYSHLCKQAFEGVTQRYGAVRPEVMERLSRELSVIERAGFAAYFLIVLDIVAFCKREGISVVGRGSAADSIVSYALGITRVDPLEHDLTFERFLNPHRTDPPDIDLDINWRDRDRVLEYVYERYGKEKVAMISTLARFQARSAFRDVAKAFGLALPEINQLSKRLPHVQASKLLDALVTFPECRDFPVDREPYRSIVRLAMRMDGYPMHLGIHCGGMVIADKVLTDYVALERAPKGLVVTQYDMRGIEALGLVKMDLLGHRTLAVIDECIEEVRRNRGVEIDLDAIAPDDPEVAKTLSAGRTLGCFQIESPGMRNLLQMIKAKDRLDVIMGLSLIRPGPSSSGMKERFIRRRTGSERTTYLAPQLEKVLADTYGVMLYQEDILKVAWAVAGFTLAEADMLRRAVDKNKDFDRFRERFLSGAKARGVPERNARELWRQVLGFAGYSYCKAHAVTYGYISYETTWLKTYYPAEFLAAVLSNPGGYYHAGVYIEEARRSGVAILGVDVNESDHEYCGDHEYCAEGGSAIRVGLMQLKNVAQKTIESILDARKERPFRSLADFCLRTTASFDETKTLALAGAFDSFPGTRPEKLWQIEAHFRDIEEIRRTARDGLFHDALPLPDLERLPQVGGYDTGKALEVEEAALDVAVGAHPLAMYADAVADVDRVHACDLRAHVGKTVTLVGVLVAARRAITTKGKAMKFLSIEDETGLVEVTLFPETYQHFGGIFYDIGPYAVTGKVEDQHGAVTITARSVRRLIEE